MLLKLSMAFGTDAGFRVCRAVVEKWYKRADDRVEYGDVLLDLRVEETEVPEATADLARRVEALNRDPRLLAEMGERRKDAAAVEIQEVHSDKSRRLRKDERLLLRVKASARGIVRHVAAREGDELARDDLLAIISTHGDELDLTGVSIEELSVFRTVETSLEAPAAKTGVPAAAGARRVSGDHFVVLRGTTSNGGGGVGIYTQGVHYTNSIFASVPLLEESLRERALCIYRDGLVNLPSYVMAQSLTRDFAQWPEIFETKFQLPEKWFRSRVFQKTFAVPVGDREEEFEKSVVALSIVPDVAGIAFRHDESGYYFDPVAVWSNRHLRATRPRGLLPDVTAEDLAWFRRNVTRIGPVPVERSMASLDRIIKALRDDMGIQPLVFNTLAAGPGAGIHNYQFVQQHRGTRRLEFNLALAELSRDRGFPIVDVDRIAKRAGITTQFDWDEVDPHLHSLVGREVVGILRDLEVIE